MDIPPLLFEQWLSDPRSAWQKPLCGFYDAAGRQVGLKKVA